MQLLDLDDLFSVVHEAGERILFCCESMRCGTRARFQDRVDDAADI